ncbi:hypothetical protein J4E93_001187 [Alternaria ventricosa]|uniref:uncharacterized protein n=1 Tax=Alternaria ventricosa TaxID=1187951 RepID=UPI0020C56293|nr:uncharacterized protein J4E93_001187 [Alternaria ventricosa]KAI4653421.1 hypothetical protein J4E93_001187 [Alternaria ventricosa]
MPQFKEGDTVKLKGDDVIYIVLRVLVGLGEIAKYIIEKKYNPVPRSNEYEPTSRSRGTRRYREGFRRILQYLNVTVPFDKLPVVPTAGTDRKNKSSSIAIPKGNDYDATTILLNEDMVCVVESEDDEFDLFA